MTSDTLERFDRDLRDSFRRWQTCVVIMGARHSESSVLQRRQTVWPFRLVLVLLVLVCSGCATTPDAESVAKGNRVTLLVLGTGNKWAPRTEPDLYVVVAARHPTPTEKVQIDLSDCQAATRTVWNSDAAARDRTILAAQG